ncbi:putative BSD domain-containing protein [Helianthus annuus]|nr:putative BSD domain-containing protein [Helianthus annuus]
MYSPIGEQSPTYDRCLPLVGIPLFHNHNFIISSSTETLRIIIFSNHFNSSMDFFRSILSDDPEPESPHNHSQSDSNPIQNHSPNHPETEADEEDEDSTSNLNSSDDGSGGASSGGGGGGLWSLGDLVKTLTTKSESVFETYRRDLQEFGTGLRKESDLFREVASRAVKELPASIDVGTSAIDGVLKSTAEIIAQGKEVLLASSDVDESDSSDRYNNSERSGVDLNNSVRYSRFDAQLNAIRNDVRVFVEDPEDVEDYNKWKLGFVVGDKKDEIEELIGENGGLEEVYAKLVPNEVDDGTFWFRYFYKVYKLKLQEEMRAKLVKRSLSVDDEEELSWDVDDDDDEEEEEQQQHHKLEPADSEDGGKKQSADDKIETQRSKIVDEDKEMITNVVSVDKNSVEEPKLTSEIKTHVEEAESVPKSGETVDVKPDSAEAKDSNVTVKSSEPSFQEDEDLEWDEIEDLGKTDDKNVIHGDTTTNKADLRKRLSTVADEDEDLSWDIEDDDEPVKSGNK